LELQKGFFFVVESFLQGSWKNIDYSKNMSFTIFTRHTTSKIGVF